MIMGTGIKKYWQKQHTGALRYSVSIRKLILLSRDLAVLSPQQLTVSAGLRKLRRQLEAGPH
jgi:hypothetical protein